MFCETLEDMALCQTVVQRFPFYFYHTLLLVPYALASLFYLSLLVIFLFSTAIFLLLPGFVVAFYLTSSAAIMGASSAFSALFILFFFVFFPQQADCLLRGCENLESSARELLFLAADYLHVFMTSRMLLYFFFSCTFWTVLVSKVNYLT